MASEVKLLIQYPLMLLGLVGMNPLVKPTAGFLRGCLILFVILSNIMLIVINIVVTYENIDSLGKAEVVPYLIEISFCVLLLKFKRSAFLDLIHTDTFWPSDKYGPAVQKGIEKQKQLILKIVKVNFILTYSTYLVYAVKPIILYFTYRRMENMIEIYDWCDITNNLWCFIVNYIYLSGNHLNVPLIAGVDGIFLMFLAEILGQFSLIEYALRNLPVEDEDETLVVLNQVVDQHNNVLKFVRDLNSFFSMYILTKCFASTITFVLTFYLMLRYGIPPSIDRFSKYMGLASCFLLALSMFNVSGQFLTEKSQKVADAAMDSNWWLYNHLRARKTLLMIIRRSNEPVILSIGGLWQANLTVVIGVVKTAFSFYTLMQNIIEEN